MPYVNLQITKGATRDQKAQIVKEFTETLVRVLGKNPAEHPYRDPGDRAFGLGPWRRARRQAP